MANFLTDGSTTTQSALSSTSCGMLSCAFKISCITFPALSTRSSSFFCAYTGSASVASNPMLIHFFIYPPQHFRARIPDNHTFRHNGNNGCCQGSPFLSWLSSIAFFVTLSTLRVGGNVKLSLV